MKIRRWFPVRRPRVTLPADLHHAIQVAAELDSLTVAEWVTRAVTDGLPRYTLATDVAS